MDRVLWPAAVPELFCDAAGRLLFGQAESITAQRLREGLGVDQALPLDDGELLAALAATRQDPATFDRTALAVALGVGRRLDHQYPASSLLWDLVTDELHEVLVQCGFDQPVTGLWTRPAEAGRTLVIELDSRPATAADERRFTLRWGVVLPALPFCGHDGPHRVACAAVLGGLGAVRAPHGDHVFVLSVGLLAEVQGGEPARLVGQEAFRARLYRLATFCDGLGNGSLLVELVAGQPWRTGVGVAEQLRNADPHQLRRLLA